MCCKTWAAQGPCSDRSVSGSASSERWKLWLMDSLMDCGTSLRRAWWWENVCLKVISLFMILFIKFSRLWFHLDLEMGFQELLMTWWLGVKKMYYSVTFIGHFNLHQSVTCQLENAPLHPIPALSQPLEHLLVDFVSPLSNSKAGSMYFFTVIPLVSSSIFTDMLITLSGSIRLSSRLVYWVGSWLGGRVAMANVSCLQGNTRKYWV